MNILSKLGLGGPSGFTARKTVTFGDESAVTANRLASILSVLAIFLVWGMFTGSKWVPVHVPGPFVGETGFSYTISDGTTEGQGNVAVTVHERGAAVDVPKIEADPNTVTTDDTAKIEARRRRVVDVMANDTGATEAFKVTQIDGRPIAPGGSVALDHGVVEMTDKGRIAFEPTKGWQMEPIWLPPPEAVIDRLKEIAAEGYRGYTLAEHVGYSLFRVFMGFLTGCLVGIPLGYAMGLNGFVRGWFDPIVEFMRPVPPLALIPLVIIWFGINEEGKIILLFLAALWIMTIAARAGVSGVKLSKVHAAYSLGASKWQVLTKVIVPNSLPEIFTGARVAMGVCWGTVVAAELVAAAQGAGQMIMVASKFQLTDIVLMGIITIGVIGYGIDILMRRIENWLIPWKGKG